MQSGYFAPVNDIKAGGPLLWLERKALLQHLGRTDLTVDDIAIFEALGDDVTHYIHTYIHTLYTYTIYIQIHTFSIE